MNQSYWQRTTKKTNDEKINDHIVCDVVIIGGGLTGVTLAYYLRNSSLKVVVVDKDELGSHTSGHTTAKITALHDVLYYKINKHYDKHSAYLYYQSNARAISDINDIIKKEKIECDYRQNISYIYALNPQTIQILQEQKDIFDSIRIPYITDNQHRASMGLKDQAVFHPLKYLFALKAICEKKGVSFYEKSLVTKVKESGEFYDVFVNETMMKCRYVVYACRYPFFKKHFYYLKMFQQREYIDYVEEQTSDDSYLCLDKTYSYRPVGQRGSLQISDQSQDWYAMDSIPIRGIPYIGRLKKEHNEFIAFGFQKWGMTLSHVSAKLISDLILEKDNAYEKLYAPDYFSISFFNEYKETMLDHLKRGYLTNRIHTKEIKDIQNGEGALVKEEGRLYALYKDHNGECFYMSPYCRHLKCVVSFDMQSRTWTCPCHQSIYDVYGKVIEGPALSDLKKKSE